MVEGTSIDDIENLFELPVNIYLSLPEPCPRIHNIVGTVYFGINNINLRLLAAVLGISSYRNSRLSAVTIRYTGSNRYSRPPTFQVFNNGWGVLMGAYCVYDLLLHIHFLRFQIASFPFIKTRPYNSRVCISNRVSTAVCPPLDIKTFEKQNRISVISNPTTFPGIVYLAKVRDYPNHISLSLFKPGRINAMGFDPLTQKDIFIHLVPILRRNYSKVTKESFAEPCIRALHARLQGLDLTNISCVDLVKGVFEEVQTRQLLTAAKNNDQLDKLLKYQDNSVEELVRNPPTSSKKKKKNLQHQQQQQQQQEEEEEEEEEYSLDSQFNQSPKKRTRDSDHEEEEEMNDLDELSDSNLLENTDSDFDREMEELFNQLEHEKQKEKEEEEFQQFIELESESEPKSSFSNTASLPLLLPSIPKLKPTPVLSLPSIISYTPISSSSSSSFNSFQNHLVSDDEYESEEYDDDDESEEDEEETLEFLKKLNKQMQKIDKKAYSSNS